MGYHKERQMLIRALPGNPGWVRQINNMTDSKVVETLQKVIAHKKARESEIDADGPSSEPC